MEPVRLFLGGDLMTGRGVDQVLPHPGEPSLREVHLHDARDYVALAEKAGGRVSAPVAFAHPWGEALEELARFSPDLRLVNLETSVTRSSDFSPDKDVHYRMSPANGPVLPAAGLDAVSLANNHSMDFGRRGLLETLDVLASCGIAAVGAGRDRDEARRVHRCGRALICGAATEDSGVPRDWIAAADRPGVNLVDLSDASADGLADSLRAGRRPGDVAVVSIHWGSNWGYEVPAEHVRFAHRLVEKGVDLVHGHSSHHPRPIEVHRGRLILYGCGDLIDDYEGIGGYESFRPDLAVLYFPQLDSDGALRSLDMVPMRIHRMRLERASLADDAWLAARLTSVGPVVVPGPRGLSLQG